MATVDVRSVEAILAAARQQGLTIEWALETHAHADHLSGAPYIKAKTGARIGIGEHIKDVQRIFRPVFNATDLKHGRQRFRPPVRRWRDVSASASLTVEVMHTPGHTPADISYKIGDAVFVGDTLFMPDYGTARADFPGGDAAQLYRSIQRLLALPPRNAAVHVPRLQGAGPRHLRLGDHGARGARRATSMCKAGVTEDEFVAMRKARDATLSAPTLLLPSIQVNIRAGRFPKAEQNGVHYLLLPVRPKTEAAATIMS